MTFCSKELSRIIEWPFKFLPEKVPENTPEVWLTKLSITAPDCLHNLAEEETCTLPCEEKKISSVHYPQYSAGNFNFDMWW